MVNHKLKTEIKVNEKADKRNYERWNRVQSNPNWSKCQEMKDIKNYKRGQTCMNSLITMNPQLLKMKGKIN